MDRWRQWENFFWEILYDRFTHSKHDFIISYNGKTKKKQIHIFFSIFIFSLDLLRELITSNMQYGDYIIGFQFRMLDVIWHYRQKIIIMMFSWSPYNSYILISIFWGFEMLQEKTGNFIYSKRNNWQVSWQYVALKSSKALMNLISQSVILLYL